MDTVWTHGYPFVFLMNGRFGINIALILQPRMFLKKKVKKRERFFIIQLLNLLQ